MLMKLALLGLCHIASIWAKPDEAIAAKKVQVIPPGYTTMNLVNGNGSAFFLLTGQSFVGNNSQPLNFTFNSRYPNILFGGPDYTVSGSYVDQGLVVPVTVPNSSFNLFTNPANVSREWFTLSSVPNVAQIRGQIGGYVQNGTDFGPNTMGFQLNHSIFLNDAFFLDTAFQQAYISNKVISFAVNFSNINNPGQAYIGALNPGNFTTLTNFSVDVNTGEWSMYLANMGTVSTDWGYNGYLTWDTSSPVNIVPRSVQRLMLQYLNVSSVTFGTFGNVTVAIIPCQPGGSYPYFYYTLSGNKQLTFSVDQYLIPFNSTAGTCVFTFGTSNSGAPYGRAPYTIGSYAFHNAYTSFDFENRWVGRTELLPQP